jgi:PAS domain S-box-containing protein
MTPQPEAYMIHDGKTILEVNDAFLELFHCHEQEILDRCVEDVIANPDLRDLARARGKYIMEYGLDETRQEYEFLRFNGARFWGAAISHRMDYGRYKTIIQWEYNIT